MNRNKIFFILLLISLYVNFYGSDFFYNRKFVVDRFKFIEIKDGNLSYYEYSPNGYKMILDGKYKIFKKNNYEIINVNEKSFVVFYLLDSIILCDIQTKEIILGTDYEKGGFSVSLEPHLFYFNNVKASSYLKEGNIKFLSSNLENYDLIKPWVEGEKGDGIGSKIYFELDAINNIVIANGYFDPQKLYLYEYNNRVKKIKIKSMDENSKFEIIFDLEDSYNLQMIKLPKKTTKIEITILEVYKGTKYSDTVISGLFTNYYLSYTDKNNIKKN